MFIFIFFVCAAYAPGIVTSFCAERCHICDATEQCQECVSGYYGADCLKNCSGCWDDGCDIDTGICFNCPAGFYSKLCDIPCPDGCDTGGGGKTYCDRETGKCSDGCLPTLWGYTCDKKCNATCGICYQQDGNCLKCRPEWSGEKCETCSGSECRYDVKCPERCFICNDMNDVCANCSHGWNETCGHREVDSAEQLQGVCGTTPIAVLALAVVVSVLSFLPVLLAVILTRKIGGSGRHEEEKDTDADVPDDSIGASGHGVDAPSDDKATLCRLTTRVLCIMEIILLTVAVGVIIAACVTWCSGLLSLLSIVLSTVSFILDVCTLMYLLRIWQRIKKSICSDFCATSKQDALKESVIEENVPMLTNGVKTSYPPESAPGNDSHPDVSQDKTGTFPLSKDEDCLQQEPSEVYRDELENKPQQSQLVSKEEKVNRRKEALKFLKSKDKQEAMDKLLCVEYTSDEEVDAEGNVHVKPLGWDSQFFQKEKENLDNIYFTKVKKTGRGSIKRRPVTNSSSHPPARAPSWIITSTSTRRYSAR